MTLLCPVCLPCCTEYGVDYGVPYFALHLPCCALIFDHYPAEPHFMSLSTYPAVPLLTLRTYFVAHLFCLRTFIFCALIFLRTYFLCTYFCCNLPCCTPIYPANILLCTYPATAFIMLRSPDGPLLFAYPAAGQFFFERI